MGLAVAIDETKILKPIVQEEATGCGIAAVANIVGKNYAEMKG